MIMALFLSAVFAGYPQIQEVKGVVKYSDKDQVVRALTKNSILKEKAELLIDEKASCVVSLSPNTKLIIIENSIVSFPLIDENGLVQKVYLNKGHIQWIQKEKGPLTLETEVTSTSVPQGEYMLSYEPTSAKVGLTVVEGSAFLGGVLNEKSLHLKSMTRGEFTGVLEQGKPAFDFLLKGKRVAKGDVKGPMEVTIEQMNEIKKPFLKAQVVERPKKLIPKDPQAICRKPEARLNQCSWTCDRYSASARSCQGSCTRYRCNAEGQWVDAFVESPSSTLCQKSPTVASCPY